MNWEAVGAIGEIIGALAVVVSVIYLAIQIRQNTDQVGEQIKALKLEGHNAAATDHSRFRQNLIRSPQVASLWQRCRGAYLDLPPEEKAQASALMQDFFWANANMLLRNQQSESIDEELWSIAAEGLRPYVAQRGVREWWVEAQAEFPSEFRRAVDRMIEEQSDGT